MIFLDLLVIPIVFSEIIEIMIGLCENLYLTMSCRIFVSSFVMSYVSQCFDFGLSFSIIIPSRSVCGRSSLKISIEYFIFHQIFLPFHLNFECSIGKFIYNEG